MYSMRGGCLLAVGARRARGSNKFSSVQYPDMRLQKERSPMCFGHAVTW